MNAKDRARLNDIVESYLYKLFYRDEDDVYFLLTIIDEITAVNSEMDALIAENLKAAQEMATYIARLKAQIIGLGGVP